jgi:hypothetical protein
MLFFPVSVGGEAVPSDVFVVTDIDEGRITGACRPPTVES